MLKRTKAMQSSRQGGGGQWFKAGRWPMLSRALPRAGLFPGNSWTCQLPPRNSSSQQRCMCHGYGTHECLLCHSQSTDRCTQCACLLNSILLHIEAEVNNLQLTQHPLTPNTHTFPSRTQPHTFSLRAHMHKHSHHTRTSTNALISRTQPHTHASAQTAASQPVSTLTQVIAHTCAGRS